MSLKFQLQREVILDNLEAALTEYTKELFGKEIEECGNEELYKALLKLTKNMLNETEVISGVKKVYYISAEFLIGKLLSNNLINLKIYDKVKSVLESKGKNLAEIEEVEPEPSLGNGGLGRLAAC